MRDSDAQATIGALNTITRENVPAIALTPEEMERAAEAMYIEQELIVRGDGLWNPWKRLSTGLDGKERYRRMLHAMLREVNKGRMEKG